MNPTRFTRNDERGMALITALMIMLLMSALMVSFAAIMTSDQRFRGIDKDRNRAYYGAQSGLEKLTVDLGNLFLTNVAPTNLQIANLANNPPVISGVTFTAQAPVVAYGVTPLLQLCGGPPAVLQLTCSGTVQNGPYQGLIALKKVYGLDAVAKTTNGGEAHLTRKIESVAIPVYQFGTFSDVDLSLFAGGAFTFGGRIHTNGNLFAQAQNGWTTTLTDKVTAYGDIIRQTMQNGLDLAAAGFNGTIQAATAPNTYRAILATDGSLQGGVGSAPNPNWHAISLATYNAYIRNGGCPLNVCSVPPRGTGVKQLQLPLITVGGTNPDLVRRPPVGEDMANPTLYGERMYGKPSLRILMSDTVADIMNLPGVTNTPPIRLGDEILGGTSNDWSTVGQQPAGYGPVDATHPPIARSPGLQSFATTGNTNAGDTTIAIANVNPPAGATSAFNFPSGGAANYLQFNFVAPVAQTVNCSSISANAALTQITISGCFRNQLGGLAAVNANNTVTITDTNGRTRNNYITVGNVANTANNTTTRSYVLTTAVPTPVITDLITNNFWMKSTLAGANPDNGWYPVTCNGMTTTPPVGAAPAQITANGWPLATLTGCNTTAAPLVANNGWCVAQPNCGVPQTAAGAGVITTAALTARDVSPLGGYLKIEIQKTDHTWQDVTLEILNAGFSAPNQDGAPCADPTPNAIIRLQRLRDNGSANNLGCIYAASTSSYDYWPQTIFDTREALLRVTQPANQNKDIILGGVMHYVSIDVGNLSKWFKRQAPFGASSGNLVLLDNNGYSVYFSDRRNNRDLNSLETGEYGWEDIVNPNNANGAPNNQLDAGEDFNANGVLDTYGQFPNFLGNRNQLPPGAVAPFNVAANVNPQATLGRSSAMTTRAYLFRRALKLENASADVVNGITAMQGFTVVTENPVYIDGDWNWNAAAAVGAAHSETSVVADAVTLLSNSWTDANAFRNPYDASQRVRATNSYRLAIIGGKGPAFPWPAAGNPDFTFGTDGGAHNFLRYLESGNAGTTNFMGSIATFYYSRQATGTYKFSLNNPITVYSAPSRNYAFDADFLDPAKLPPLTPMFRDLNALGFTQEMRPGK